MDEQEKSKEGEMMINGISHLCLDVTDIDAEFKRLKDASMTFNCPPQDLGALRSTYGRDPEGNVIELHEVVDHTSPVHLDLS